MPAKPNEPVEEPNEAAETEEPEYANRAERRAAQGKKKTGTQQQTFGKGKVVGKGNGGPSQRIWSNRKAG
jgi:hypothetical protein